MGECLPPSTRKVFRFLGIGGGGNGRRVLRDRGQHGVVGQFATPRRVLSGRDWLAGAAEQVRRAAAGISACRGRALVGTRRDSTRGALDARLLRQGRGPRAAVSSQARQHSRTVALTAVWRNDSGWRLPDATRTLVEAYGDELGMEYSTIPHHTASRLHGGIRQETRLTRGQGVAAAYAAELSKSRAFRRIFATSRMEGVPWGRDASPYTSPALLRAPGSCWRATRHRALTRLKLLRDKKG